ncbi:DUF6428 family protein [Rufibacter quisquiliarum]|uniref:Uncharacterized protein n=1 Tax=Rufibacter quisquiliarum TaxID=1549639 RepID=A0A839GDR6_9BACT|nr:DUF6428 family protein [Rufibacter quisquiliarum]MBA9075673.1 hypothetical protein [Rufibacter quisquiliarum]
MKLSEVKALLAKAETVEFSLENGNKVPDHFHVTEVGVVSKHFIDCGGTVRNEKVANFQLWDANDVDHRLKPQKLLNIIGLSEKTLGMEDLEVEVEYQSGTIGRYDLGHDGQRFVLLAKTTTCLAPDKCGVPQEKMKLDLSQLIAGPSCEPGSGCC